MNKFFIDTTIWIEFFKGRNKAICHLMTSLIDEGLIFYNGIILSELLIGALNEKELELLENNFDGFEYLETDKEIFKKSSYMGFKLKRQGITIPLTDIIIAAHCFYNDLTLVTSDEHFKIMHEKLKLKLKFLK